DARGRGGVGRPRRRRRAARPPAARHLPGPGHHRVRADPRRGRAQPRGDRRGHRGLRDPPAGREPDPVHVAGHPAAGALDDLRRAPRAGADRARAGRPPRGRAGRRGGGGGPGPPQGAGLPGERGAGWGGRGGERALHQHVELAPGDLRHERQPDGFRPRRRLADLRRPGDRRARADRAARGAARHRRRRRDAAVARPVPARRPAPHLPRAHRHRPGVLPPPAHPPPPPAPPRPPTAARPPPPAPAPGTGAAPSATGFLVVDKVTCRFGGVLAVDEVSFAVARGELFGLIGPNGAGKTTLFNIVTGLTPPSGGRLRYQDRDITGLPPHRIAERGIARTFQNVRLFGDLSALDNVMIARHVRTRSGLMSGVLGLGAARREERATRERAGALLEMVGLADRPDERARNFSYGDQRRLEIARALALEPELLL